jgi:hypothetical protein
MARERQLGKERYEDFTSVKMSMLFFCVVTPHGLE